MRRRNLKRFVSIAISMAMIMSALSFYVFAEDEVAEPAGQPEVTDQTEAETEVVPENPETEAATEDVVTDEPATEEQAEPAEEAAVVKPKAAKTEAFKPGWVEKGGFKYYYYAPGKYHKYGVYRFGSKLLGFDSKGRLITSNVWQIKGVYHYSDSKGYVRTRTGTFSFKGDTYYSQSNGNLATNKLLKFGGKGYVFGSNAKMQKNKVVKVGSTYYYVDPNGKVRTVVGFFNWAGNRYCVKNTTGALYAYQFANFRGSWYYFNPRANVQRKAFTYKNFSFHPDSVSGIIPQSEYYKYEVSTYGPYPYKKYVLIDISDQRLLYYENGSVRVDSPVVTGNAGNHNTPTGTFSLVGKSRNETLKGVEDDGVTEYASFVNFWMPFIGQSIGMHDATWRGSFGGTIYRGNGSHGCVNMPYAKAQALYGMISIGTPVIVRA